MANSDEHLRIAQDYVHATLKGLLLINGGAVVALYTVLGTVGANANRHTIWAAFALFAVALALTIFAGIAGYAYHVHEMNECGVKSRLWEKVAIGCVASSLFMFLFGAGLALLSVLTAPVCAVLRA